MSAQPLEKALDQSGVSARPAAVPDVAPTPEPLEVRRNAVVSGAIGACAAAIAIAYLRRGVASGAVLDWVLCAGLGVVAVAFLRSMLDSRTPLLVVDEMGVRVRLGSHWLGLPWEAVDRVAVRPRRGLLRDGRLVVSVLPPERAFDGLRGRALRHAHLNQKVYGAPLAVPLGLTTRIAQAGPDGATTDLAEAMAARSRGRAEVLTLLDAPGDVARAAVLPSDALPAPTPEREPTAEAVPLRRRTAPFRVIGAITPVPGRAERRAKDSRVRPMAEVADAVDPPVIDEFQPRPAYDPVIGPELAAARTRVGLSVDELAERTRIRPHVIESIEVDDFAPCGGDFYARGHIRTLARMLGKAPEPLLEHFEARYATGPVTAKRVFEAELATGMTGTVRGGGLGGPNWALLAAVALLLVLVWSGVRLLAGVEQDVLETPPPVLTGSSALTGGYGTGQEAAGPQPVPVTVTAVNAGAHIEVRDGGGELVFDGDLVIGEAKRVAVEPPVTVSSDNAGAVAVVVSGRDMGRLGAAEQPATRVFQRPAD